MPDIPTEKRSIWIQIKLYGQGLASGPEFDLRWELQDAVSDRGIGEMEGGGSGAGWMDFSFAVDSIEAVEPALAAVRNLMTEYKVGDDEFRLEVFQRTELVCHDTPKFQPGDCLSYKFSDGDYGAALVLDVEPPENDRTLLGLLDYKAPVVPPLSIFEQRHWLISTQERRTGQPYLVWVFCYGGIEIEVVHHLAIRDDDPMICVSQLDWELIPEYFIRDKYRDMPELNPYEIDYGKAPFQSGDCLAYRFPNGDYGAALVLQHSADGPNSNETLVGILNYKQQIPPSLAVFEQRQWLLSGQTWRAGQPYTIWALWNPENIEIIVAGQTALRDDEPKLCQLNLNWADIPEFVLRENIG